MDNLILNTVSTPTNVENNHKQKKNKQNNFVNNPQDHTNRFPKPNRIPRDDESGFHMEPMKMKRFNKNKQKSNNTSGKISNLFANNPEIPGFAKRAVKPVKESVFSTKNFKDLDIHSYLVSNLEQEQGLSHMTTVQSMAIPTLLENKDALVRSQTGSGKTLAYAIPIVHTLQAKKPPLSRIQGVHALVVVPTRELALQTYECFIKLVKPFMRLVPGILIGGEKKKSEKARLRKGITILVGTPGRLLDHIKHTKSLSLERVQWLVLDEADRMLDMGYQQDVSTLISELNEQRLKYLYPDANATESGPSTPLRQTVLLSATLTPAVERLAGLALHNPVRVDAAGADNNVNPDEIQDLVLPDSLRQFYLIAPPKLRLVILAGFIIWKCQTSDQQLKLLVFMATQDMVDFYAELFSRVLGKIEPPTKKNNKSESSDEDSEDCEDGPKVDIEFFRLHGNMTQKDRTDVFKTFRHAKTGVLFCTDVAARGLDLPHADWAVQLTAPTSVADYVHRAGRVARAGAFGRSLLILAPSEVEFLRSLEDRSVRLEEEPMKKILNQLRTASLASLGEKTGGSTSSEAAATSLQMRFEEAISCSKQLHDQACKAYISWVRFYASLPRDIREIFSFKELHLGHFAKSFGLRDPPKNIAGIRRQSWMKKQESKNEGGDRKKHTDQRHKKTAKVLGSGKKRLHELMTSEFATGLEPSKKKRKTEID